MITEKYAFAVPDLKKIRLIINTDAKNEADDQYAIVHALLTPKFCVRGITAAHFGTARGNDSMQQSYDEIVRVLNLMNMQDGITVWHGAPAAVQNRKIALPTEGSEGIINEALADDPMPLFAIFLGPLSDLATAIMHCPEICRKMTAVWTGGERWPEGGSEFNCANDSVAADIVFRSQMPLWQIPRNVYNLLKVGLSELQTRVRPFGRVGAYLFRQLVEFNDSFADNPGWPHGESWVLGDSAAIGVLLDQHEYDYSLKPAPELDSAMKYIHSGRYREIRVYHNIDTRFILEDFYAKLQMNYAPDQI
ncbi:MAG: nucleoside hydrolase [Spirochaetales bacterium]|nr:nucleoside hydrolase [Spirochaetales bacterium]